jgi:Fur family ferric uptake transcriptional regulator
MATPALQHTIDEVKDIFRDYLKKNGHRQTPERFMVLEEIYKADGHFDADDMYFKMKNTGYRVSRATVYNTLDLLVECGLVQRHQFRQNQSYYERAYAYRQHDHILCDECGAIIEFCDPRIFEIQSLMQRIHDFNVNGHSLHFYGSCNDPANCSRKADLKQKEQHNNGKAAK